MKITIEMTTLSKFELLEAIKKTYYIKPNPIEPIDEIKVIKKRKEHPFKSFFGKNK